jgi:two-component system response regulator ResD
MNVKVLVADDDANVCEIIRLFFTNLGMQLIEANDGKTALQLIHQEKPDVIILDVMMPEMDGLEVCKEVRRELEIPIIMLTARGEEFDRVLGLELGADDYVTKPFSPRELLARVKAVLRRAQPKAEGQEFNQGMIEFPDLVIDKDRREVLVGGKPVTLRPKEFDLLAFLAQSAGKVFTREHLLERVWGYDFFGDMRTVDVHIKKLRKGLSDLPYDPITTVWGVGYKFEVSNG